MGGRWSSVGTRVPNSRPGLWEVPDTSQPPSPASGMAHLALRGVAHHSSLLVNFSSFPSVEQPLTYRARRSALSMTSAGIRCTATPLSHARYLLFGAMLYGCTAYRRCQISVDPRFALIEATVCHLPPHTTQIRSDVLVTNTVPQKSSALSHMIPLFLESPNTNTMVGITDHAEHGAQVTSMS